MRRRVPHFEAAIRASVRELIVERERSGRPIDDDELQSILQAALAAASTVMSENVLASLIERLPALTEKIAEDRRGFEARLRRAWGPALAALDGLINGAMEIGGKFYEEERRQPDWGLADESLVRLHARAILVTGEIAALLRAGFASGAQARWRTLHELAVTGAFLSEHRELAEAWIGRAFLEEARLLRKAAAAAKRRGGPGPSEREIVAAEAQAAALRSTFGPAWEAGDYGWASPAFGGRRTTFADLEASVSLDHARPYVHEASRPVHSGPSGVFDDIGAIANRGSVLLAGASNTGLGTPGQMAASTLGLATVTLLLHRESLDRTLEATAFIAFADEVGDRFGRCDDNVEAAVRRNWGHMARRKAFARRAARAVRSSRPRRVTARKARQR